MSRDTASRPGAGNPPAQADATIPRNLFQPGSARFPLTIAQAPIALDALALPNSPVANTGDIARIQGRIDPEIFAAACRWVVAETPSIRVSLSYRLNAVVQEFLALDDYVLEQHDFSQNDQPEEAARTWIENEFWKPRPWNSFPLFQFALLKIGDDRFVFLQKFHHVLADAIGRFQCFRRIAAIYEALVHDVEPPPPELLSLTDRVAEEQAYLESKAYQADLAYWTRRLEALPDRLVDADRNRSERGRSGRSRRQSQEITAEEFARLKQAAADLGTSVPRLTLALTAIAVARLHGVTDLVIGTPLHNRGTQAAKRSIDLAMTVMPFRMTFESQTGIAALVKDIATKQLADLRRSRFPFASLTRPDGRREAGHGVFDVIFNYIPAMGAVCLGDAEVVYNNYSAGFYLPWAIDLRETQDSQAAILTVAFDPGLIEAGDGARLAKCIHFLLTNPVALEEQTAGSIPIISDRDRHHLLVELNDTDHPLPADATLASLCAAQAERTPDAVAVIHGSQSITYAALHARANAVASRLTQSGVGPDVIVGVALPRSIEMIVALLAIHKAGGAYLPLETALPAERLAYIIGDAQTRLIVTVRTLTDHLPETEAKHIFLDDLADAQARGAPAAAPQPDHLAYVIYTSGSTGLPKGVAVEHRNAANLVQFHAAQLGPEERSGILFSSSLNFDASIDEIFVSLASGGRLIIVETLLALPAAPAQGEVRVMEAAPSVFEALLQIGGFRPGLRLIRFGGEPLARALADRVWAIDPDVRIENSYGPTEVTVDATISELRANAPGDPPIGKGLWNTKLYVLDRNMELLPKGAKGELYIGGAGVARGYLSRPELTAERFAKNPFGGGRLYRTGDVVRWREDGELEFFSRTDTQVKINGLRIELGEIERQLESMPEVASAVAIVRPDDHGVKRIFAFAVPRNANNRPDFLAVSRFLEEKLPKYMVPAALAWTDAFPLTPSGKLDRNALSLPAWESAKRSYRAPSTKLQSSLVQIWTQILQIRKIGIDDDFFELGGTSLQAVMIFARIANLHGVDLPAATMLGAPTIARQAALLKEHSDRDGQAMVVAFREKGKGPPLFFIHGAGGGVMHVRDLMQDLKCRNPLYGLRPPPLDGSERLPRSIAELAAAYVTEIRKVQPAGPYHLIGYSVGGTIAYEMAQQLRRTGGETGLLGLIETDARRFRKAIQQSSPRTPRRPKTGQKGMIRTARRIVRTGLNHLALMPDAAQMLLNESRHGLGLAIPHGDRMSFYTSKLSAAESVYMPRRYPGVITMFARISTGDYYRWGWSHLATGGLIVRELPVARHLDIVLLPNSRFLAMQIDTCLNEANAGQLPSLPD